jgi:uroporphyrin-3 C-methyltransferase
MSSTDIERTASGSSDAGGKATASGSSKSAGPGGALSWLALLLALAALVAAGWSGWQLSSMQDLPGRLEGDAARLSELAAQLESIEGTSRRQQQMLAELEQSLASGLSIVPDLDTRLRRSEMQLAEIPGVSTRIRGDWLKKEALYYLQVANAQVTLVGDAGVAVTALQLADDKLLEAADPAFTPVRAELSREIAALRAVPAVDETGIAFRLQSLAEQARGWPFRRTAPDSFAPPIEVTSGNPAQGAWERFVATVKEVMSSIVSVKQTGEPVTTQLGAADEALIIETVEAEIQLARLALIRGNDELFRQSLARVDDQLEAFFDTDAAAVSAARTTLAELQALELPGPLPDVSGSLGLMLSLMPDPASEPVRQSAERSPAGSPAAGRAAKPSARPAPKPTNAGSPATQASGNASAPPAPANPSQPAPKKPDAGKPATGQAADAPSASAPQSAGQSGSDGPAATTAEPEQAPETAGSSSERDDAPAADSEAL